MKNNIIIDAYVLIESLIKVSYAIENLYHKLYMLEIKGLKKSEEYQKYLGYLEMSLEYEDEIYKESNLTAFKCQYLIDLIINRYINKKMTSDLESVLSRKYENAYFRRVINKLDTNMKNDYFGMKELIISDIFEIGENDDFDYIYFNNMIKQDMKNNYIERILLFLQEKIDKVNDIKLKNKLIRDKYFISFIFPNAERNLIKNKFNIENSVCDNTQVISFINGVNKEDYKEIRKEYLEKETRKLFYKTSLKNVEERTRKERLILCECLIRALFMMMDEEQIDELNKEFNDGINNNYDTIKFLINNCIALSNKDKQKQFTLKI